MRPDISAALDDLNATLTTIEKVMDPEEMSARVRELEQQAADPSLWDDPDHAQQVTSELSAVQGQLRKPTELRQRLAQARADEDDHEVDVLLQQLETLIDLADRSDVDTTQMEAVLAAETGALPVIPAPTDD